MVHITDFISSFATGIYWFSFPILDGGGGASVTKLTLDFLHALAVARITLCICYFLHLIAVGARRVLELCFKFLRRIYKIRRCALMEKVLCEAPRGSPTRGRAWPPENLKLDPE